MFFEELREKAFINFEEIEFFIERSPSFILLGDLCVSLEWSLFLSSLSENFDLCPIGIGIVLSFEDNVSLLFTTTFILFVSLLSVLSSSEGFFFFFYKFIAIATAIVQANLNSFL